MDNTRLSNNQGGEALGLAHYLGVASQVPHQVFSFKARSFLTITFVSSSVTKQEKKLSHPSRVLTSHVVIASRKVTWLKSSAVN